MWSHAGIICTGETYKNVVKMTFAKGASLADPSGLFNSSLEGNTRRAIDFHEGDKIDEKALQGAHSRRRGTEHVGASYRSPQLAGPARRQAVGAHLVVERFARHAEVGGCLAAAKAVAPQAVEDPCFLRAKRPVRQRQRFRL